MCHELPPTPETAKTRSATNVVGNSIATAVVSKWEGELLPEAEAQREVDEDEGLTAPAAA